MNDEAPETGTVLALPPPQADSTLNLRAAPKGIIGAIMFGIAVVIVGGEVVPSVRHVAPLGPVALAMLFVLAIFFFLVVYYMRPAGRR